jgi:two-component system sensor histidine kinase TctE
MKSRLFQPASLKRRLLLTLLLPLGCIMLALGLSGAWLVSRVVQGVSDRVLSGSLQAISETLSMEEGHLTLDLPPSALGMLENSDRDNVYYSIRYRGKLITGYPELSAQEANLRLHDVRFSDSSFHGIPIRVATEAKLVPQLDYPVIVQVAETTKNRASLAHRMQLALVASELFLLVVIAALVYFAVDWGLRPLAVLRKEVEARGRAEEMDFAPLPLSIVPQEAAPFVSAFNALLGHVETSFHTLRRFTSDASHQLRAPLAVVRTHAELLGRQAGQSPEMRSTVKDIQDAVKTLQHLFVQLISLAKAERPRGDTEESVQFDLVEAAASVARTYVTRALAARMELSFEAPYDSVNVLGSPFFAGEMIGNLLDNAIRYGAAGGHIVVRIGEQLGVLEIEDDGPGVPEEQRERVFERFFRLPHHSDREGSGLGLSIVQALGRRMNATVRLETGRLGAGLKVVVQFMVPEGAKPEPVKAAIAASDEEIAP